MSNLNEERLKRFRDMGIPQPMAPVDPSSVHTVKNTAFAAKLAAIKNGAIKETVDVFLEKEGATKAFVGLPNPIKNKNKQKEQIVETIKAPSASGPSFDVYEKAMYGDNTPTSSSFEKASAPGRNYTSNVLNENENGSEFLADIKNRLKEKADRAAGAQPNVQNNHNVANSGQRLINENELRETITTISTQLIKKFMSEFLTSEPRLIKESEKIKKAEIIKDDIVKIEGKFFKLTPVTIKKK
jgi:hypothetical protein